MKPEISIGLIIPTYNRSSLIEETVQAALDQAQAFSEIIIVNDGSTDDTIDILKKYEKYIQLISTSNQGVQAARNTGVKASKSSHITLCDSDDLLDLNYVTTFHSWISSNTNNKIVYSNFQTFDETSIYSDKFSLAPDNFFLGAKYIDKFLVDIPDLYARTLQFQPLFCSGVTIEKKFYQEIGGFNPKLRGIGAEDWEFTLRAIAATSAALCTDALVKIRKHTTNDSGNSTRQAVGEAWILEYALSHHAKAKEYENIFLSEIEHIRCVAFERAFARADFSLACQMAELLRTYPTSMRFWIKRFITILPPSLRQIFWDITKN